MKSLFLYVLSCSLLLVGCSKSETSNYSYKGTYIGMFGDDSVFVDSQPLETDWSVNPIVYLGNNLVYKENDADIFFHITKTQSKIVALKNSTIGFILLTIVDPPDFDKWLVIKVKDRNFLKISRINKEIFNDIDNDGFYEIGGREIMETVCFDCDSMLYQPYNIYKLNEKFEFDSVLSKALTISLYSTYLGPEFVDTVLLHNAKIDWNITKLSSIEKGN